MVTRLASLNRPKSGYWLPRQGSRSRRKGGGIATRNFFFGLYVLLTGVALAGKGFAYIGIPPFYITEVCLVLGVFAMTRCGLQGVLQLPKWFTILVGALFLWTAMRTAPYIEEYGLAAFRDGVIVWYAGFSVIVASHICLDPARLEKLTNAWVRFARWFLGIGLICWVVSKVLSINLPTTLGTEVPIIDLKGGDTLVILAGIGASGIAGLIRFGWAVRILYVGFFVVVASVNRGGMVACCVALCVAVALRPTARNLGGTGLAVALVICLMVLGQVNLPVAVKTRSISTTQLTDNVKSVFGVGTRDRTGGTRGWRLKWWADIVDYTVYGNYRWLGKGFGVNLADADGYQVSIDGSLRSPHNGHLTILARSGVVGALLWVGLHGYWIVCIVRAWISAKKHREEEWVKIFEVLMAFWVAFMVNTSFDVYLEGPMGGSWFWVVFGVGVGACKAFEPRHGLPPVLWPTGRRRMSLGGRNRGQEEVFGGVQG